MHDEFLLSAIGLEHAATIAMIRKASGWKSAG